MGFVSGRVPPADEHFGQWGNMRASELSDEQLWLELNTRTGDGSGEVFRRQGAFEKIEAEMKRRGLKIPAETLNLVQNEMASNGIQVPEDRPLKPPGDELVDYWADISKS